MECWVRNAKKRTHSRYRKVRFSFPESSRAPEMAGGCCQVLADSERGWLGGSEGIATELVERH